MSCSYDNNDEDIVDNYDINDIDDIEDIDDDNDNNTISPVIRSLVLLQHIVKFSIKGDDDDDSCCCCCIETFNELWSLLIRLSRLPDSLMYSRHIFPFNDIFY